MLVYKSIDEALNVKLDLVERLQSIEVQLAERAAMVSGQVSSVEYQAYREWRARALRAKATISGKLSRTKAAIDKMRRDRAESRLNNNGGADGLLSDAYGLLKALAAEGAQITEEEQALMDDINAYLQSQV